MSAISELSTIHRTKAKTPEEKRLLAKEAGRDNKAGYLFLLPWLIGLVLIIGGPMIASLYLSFTNYSLIQAPSWVGLDNYARMLGSPFIPSFSSMATAKAMISCSGTPTIT